MLQKLKQQTNLEALPILGFANIIGLLIGGIGAPLITIVYYVLFKDELNLNEKQQTKHLINFYISTVIYGGVSFILTFLLIGFLLIPLVGLWSFIFAVVAIVKLITNEKLKIPFVLEIL